MLKQTLLYYHAHTVSVICPSRIGCRSVWLKGTPNVSGLLLSSQPLYGIANILKWKSTSNQQF